MGQVRGMTNPQAFISQNPALRNIMSMAQSRGMSLEQFARVLAQQKGVDINNLIHQLNS